MRQNRKWKGQQLPGVKNQDTSGLSCQCSAIEPQQPDNHQLSKSSMCTAQVVLNASVSHLATTWQYRWYWMPQLHTGQFSGQPLTGFWWLTARCGTEAFSITWAVEDCDSWWLSSCHGSVAEHWRLKPEMSWFWLLLSAGLLYFASQHLNLYFQHEARCPEQTYTILIVIMTDFILWRCMQQYRT